MVHGLPGACRELRGSRSWLVCDDESLRRDRMVRVLNQENIHAVGQGCNVVAHLVLSGLHKDRFAGDLPAAVVVDHRFDVARWLGAPVGKVKDAAGGVGIEYHFPVAHIDVVDIRRAPF